MTAVFVLIGFVLLLGYALERNHSRNGRPAFTGTDTVADRDLERIQADLAATAGRTVRPTTTTRHPDHPRHLRAA